MVELIITEKPSSAQKIAEALADTKPVKKKNKNSSYYELKHHKKSILVTSAVGHLYGLVQEKKGGWTYPIFDIKWEASSEGSEELNYIQDYIDTIEMLSKKADEFTIACDYDVEGEVIGLNVVRFACHKKDANRMKFSTLTKDELVEAYEHKRKHLDWGQAHAGETRHKLDWFYGINLSRALTSSVKAAGSFKVMSAGRVQGPALKLLVDRERDIEKFKPEPFWLIQLLGKYKKDAIEAWHEKDKIFDKKEVEHILKKVKAEKEALITSITRTTREQAPPYPFDLTTLQLESYNHLKITPKETLAIAQTLYLAGVTSYPRTSSQQLDPKLGFVKILKDLSKQSDYAGFCQELLQLKELKPNNGKKTDPAHPAIYPTGHTPKTLRPREQKVYDLIVKRFLATFSTAAIRETMEVLLDVKKEIFTMRGTRTIEANWHRFYKPYLNVEDVTLPNMKEGEIVAITDITKIDKETQPPNRFNQSSIIKELEKRNLGTKATRADILDRLFKRGYIEGVQIKVTKLGVETIVILEKYAPTIIDEKLTADFEEDMDKIREGKEKQEKVLSKAEHFLTKLLTDFKKKEKSIGKEIIQSLRETQDIQNYVGMCKTCNKGKLMVRFGKFGKFIACDKYPECKTTFKLPHGGLVRGTDKECDSCHYPKIQVIQKGKRPRENCINPQCPAKISVEGKQEIKDLQHHKIEKKCPNCGKDLVVRSSFYGKFLACPGYPDCKYTESLDGPKKGYPKKAAVKKKK
ncbi:MAG: DNA topoisomerase I [Nanoarchaeota archaeon]|nr:DNA topoisomerase I [Nanoarchaeota archaeon]